MDAKSMITRHATRGLFKLRKYSPEILTGMGVVGGIASAVMGAKATLELEPIVDDTKKFVEQTRERYDNPSNSTDYKREIAYIYTRQGLKVAKLYGPSVSLGLASVGCVLGAHGIMRKRNAALVAGYKVLETAFAEYRERIKAEVGDDRERELYFGAREEEVEDADGNKQTITVADTKSANPYTRCFDELNDNWEHNPTNSRLWLECQQNFLNDKLRVNGHLFLNEVFDRLGFERTPAGAITGWIYEDGEGDGFIDFGIYNLNKPMALAFLKGNEKAIWLEFNVDGVIYDRI